MGGGVCDPGGNMCRWVPSRLLIGPGSTIVPRGVPLVGSHVLPCRKGAPHGNPKTQVPKTRTWGTIRGCSVIGNGNTERFGLQGELQEKELGIRATHPKSGAGSVEIDTRAGPGK